jgi:regulator of protease activity HflC (stomatin/prohibitin superfamily)
MERNVQKNGLVNLVLAALVFIATLIVTGYVHSLAGLAASMFLGLGVLVALVSWFQMRLEEAVRLERLELDELVKSKGSSTLFEAKDQEVFPAEKARDQFERYCVPAFGVLLFLLEACCAAYLWRSLSGASAGFAADRALPALALLSIFALLLFLFGRFSVTLARLENHRLLRPSASFLLLGAYMCFFAALGIAGVQAEFPRADFYAAKGLGALLGLMAMEMLVTLLLEIYRPRVAGKISRPVYDSRFAGLLGQPESLFTTAAQTIDYQFGFNVSKTWFFQLLKKNLLILLFAQGVVLMLSTCFVFVDAGEQAVLERFGRPVAGGPLLPGAHFKLPWPVEKAFRYRTEQIQTFDVGYTPDPQSDLVNTILWSVGHAKEENFLVANHESVTIKNAGADDTLKAPPVSLITVSIPVQFQIHDVMAWAYHNADPAALLQDLATRTVAHYLAGVDLSDVMSRARSEAAQLLRERLQSEADARQLGVRILFVGVQDIHPPTTVAADYEKVVGAEQTKLAAILNARAEAVRTNAIAGALAFTITNIAAAARQQLEVSSQARGALFRNQIPAFEAAPSVYQQRAYFQAFAAATAPARKYVLLVTNTQDVVVFNLEDKIRDDLLNLNVNEKP